MYFVEICRYGSLKESHVFGVFDESRDEIIQRMQRYNSFRGGKYPTIKLQEISLNQEEIGFNPVEVIHLNEVPK